MKQLAISLLSAFLVACTSPLGQPCDLGQCAADYTCVLDTVVTSPTTSRRVPICARSCTHNADCGPGIDCRLGNFSNDGSRFCNDFGTLAEGARCESWADLRGCGPGLSCHRFLQTCNIDSALLAERQCPSGSTCNATERSFDDSLRTISPWAYCREQCDPADPMACRTGELCRRWLSPGIGEVYPVLDHRLQCRFFSLTAPSAAQARRRVAEGRVVRALPSSTSARARCSDPSASAGRRASGRRGSSRYRVDAAVLMR